MERNPDPDLPELFENLRAEVREARVAAILEEARAWSRRQPHAPDAPTPGFPPAWPMDIALDDVVRWHDADFVRACYEALLRRAPDPAGFALYLNKVRAGANRIEVAAGFARSEEGRLAGVRVRGLAAAVWSLRLSRVPLLGYLLRVAKWSLRGPRYLRDLQAAEAYLHARVAAAEEDAARLRMETGYVHERQARNLSARLARLSDQARIAQERMPALESTVAQARAHAVAEVALATTGLRAEFALATTGLHAELKTLRDSLDGAAHAGALAEARAQTQDARLATLEANLAALRDALLAITRLELRVTAQDAQMKAVREAGVAELAASAAALEARLTELLTREDAMLESRVGERLQGLRDVERDIEALRAALATLRGAKP